MSKNLTQIPRILKSGNIEDAIKDYNKLLKGIPLEIKSDNILTLLKDLKRGKLEYGPYPGISIFEASNRIMTDLTILYGIKELLNDAIPELHFDSFEVEFGNENEKKHDITADNGKIKLIGEAFNVATSFFHTKKSSAMKKLKTSIEKDTIMLLLFNADAMPKSYSPIKALNEYHYPVKVFEG